MLISYRADIDGIRALAIVSVVGFHANPYFIPGGFTGVDIFFVVSGYLITRIIQADLKSGEFGFAGFWVRRARRILPALLVMLFAVTLLSLYVLLPDDLDQYGQLLSHTAVFGANVFLAQDQGYFAPGAQDSPLLHVWSLAVEEQYYLLWPLLLIGGALTLRKWQLLCGVVALFCLSLTYSEWASMNAPKDAFFNLPSRAFELLAGAGLGLIGTYRGSSRALAEALSLVGVALIVAGFVLLDETTRFPGLAALLPCSGTALLLLSGSSETKTVTARLLAAPALVRIGKVSYSWYLWHWPPLAFARYYLDRQLNGLETTVALAIGIGLAVLSWRYVETPFRRTATLPPTDRAFYRAATGSAAVLFVVGLALDVGKGLPFRLAPETRTLASQFEKGKAADCDRRSPNPGRDDDECVFGNASASAPSVLLWGDSHALHYFPAIANIVEAQGLSAIARIRVSCTPFVAPAGLKTSVKRRLCGTFNQDTFAWLADRPEISVVLLASRWSGQDFLSGEANPIALFEGNLERTILTLKRMGKSIAILGQVPNAPGNVKRCMFKQSWFHRRSSGCESFPMAGLSGYEAGIWATLQNLRRVHGFALFAPQDHLCNGAICRVTDPQGRPLYRDDNHLLERGARFLEPFIHAAIENELKNSRPAEPAEIAQTTRPGWAPDMNAVAVDTN